MLAHVCTSYVFGMRVQVMYLCVYAHIGYMCTYGHMHILGTCVHMDIGVYVYIWTWECNRFALWVIVYGYVCGWVGAIRTSDNLYVVTS